MRVAFKAIHLGIQVIHQAIHQVIHLATHLAIRSIHPTFTIGIKQVKDQDFDIRP
jgi:hypothetical protein